MKSLADLKKLIDFIEKYASENPDFSAALEKEMSKKSQKSLINKGKDPFYFLEDHTTEEFREHIFASDDDLTLSYAKFLNVKPKRAKIADEELRFRIISEVERMHSHGSVFAKDSSDTKED